MPNFDTNSIPRDTNGNPKCKRCSTGITNEDLQAVWFDSRYPTVPVGPYCEECVPFMKVCNHCHNSFSLFLKEDDREDEVVYCGDGIWLCDECKSKASVCSNCNKITDELHSFSHYKKVCKTCIDEDTFECEECGDRYFNNDSTSSSYSPLEVAQFAHVLKKVEGYDFTSVASRTCKGCFSKKKKNAKPKKLSECDRCGNHFPTRAKGEKRSEKYCDHCYDNNYIFKCQWCNKAEDRAAEHGVRVGITTASVCPSCYSSKFWCTGCNSVKSNREISTHNIPGSFVHSRVTKVCSSCSTSTRVCPTCKSPTNSTTRYKGSLVCDVCKSKLNHCGRCDTFHLGEEKCRSSITTDSAHTLSYSYKPFYIPKNTELDKVKDAVLYMGIENEMSYNSTEDRQKGLTSLYKFYKATEMYPKNDGSISGPGYEAVTHPMTLNAFKKFPLKQLFIAKPRKHSSCGMHIHMSRSFFTSKLHLYKMVTIYNNWNKLVELIAGRSFNSFTNQLKKKISKTIKDGSHEGRHSIVNLSNKHTVEIRIFAGCHKASQMRYRVEFCHAMAYFSKGASLKSKEEDFIKYINKNKKVYPNLYKFLMKQWKPQS